MSDDQGRPRPDDAAPVLGIDVGGTKILGISAVGSSIVDRHRVPSQGQSRTVVDRISAVVEVLLERAAVDAQHRPPSAIGIGIAGFVGMDGIAVASPNTPGLIGVDLGAQVGERFGLPVEVNNDANCVAIAAVDSRQAKGTVAAVTIGTGVGGGLIINDRLLRGAHGFAGEPGHMVVDPSGPECPCGNTGCWERFASGTGLAWLARRAATRGEADSLVAVAGSVEAISGETVTDLLVAGDPASQAVFDEFVFYLSLGIANLIMLLDPSEVIVGGGLTVLGDQLIDPVRTCIRERFPAAVGHRSTSVVIADLGEEAGAWGAALLARSALSDATAGVAAANVAAIGGVATPANAATPANLGESH